MKSVGVLFACFFFFVAKVLKYKQLWQKIIRIIYIFIFKFKIFENKLMKIQHQSWIALIIYSLHNVTFDKRWLLYDLLKSDNVAKKTKLWQMGNLKNVIAPLWQLDWIEFWRGILIWIYKVLFSGCYCMLYCYIVSVKKIHKLHSPIWFVLLKMCCFNFCIPSQGSLISSRGNKSLTHEVVNICFTRWLPHRQHTTVLVDFLIMY